MTAIFVAILAYSLNAVVTIIDKFLLGKSIPSPIAYCFFVGILSIFVLPLFLLGFSWPGWGSVLFDLGTGMVFLAAIFVLYTALKRGEASRVVLIVGGTTPLVIFFLNLLFSRQELGALQLLAAALLVSGSIVVSWERETRKGVRKRSAEFKNLLLPALAGFFFGSFFVALDYAYSYQPFISTFVWSRLGSFLAAGLLLLGTSFRKQIFQNSRKLKLEAGGLLILNKIIAGLAFILLNYAVFAGDALIVNSLHGVEYAMLFLLAILISLKFPRILEEKLTWEVIAQKIAGVVLVSLGLVVFFKAGGYF